MPQTLEERVTLLEREMVQVKAKAKIKDTRPWWERRFGAFKNDPLYDEAVKTMDLKIAATALAHNATLIFHSLLKIVFFVDFLYST